MSGFDNEQDREAVDLLQRLVAIESTNPDLVTGGSGERGIADFAGGWLRERGFEVHRLEERSGRPSVVAIARGTGGGKSLMLNGHIDTVTLSGYDGDPLEPTTRDGKLFGRGSYDMKSGVAAAMIAATRVAKEPHAGDIIVALVADEEFASEGTAEVLRSFHSDGAIVTEPSDLEVTLSHKGFVWADVIVEGRAWHGSRPDLGIDAIAKAGAFLTSLDALAGELSRNPGHPELGPASVHASMISGGEEMSSYPAQCRIGIEWRTIPGQDSATVEAELRRMLEGVAAMDPAFRYRLEMGLERSPFEANRDDPLVRETLRIVEDVVGRPPVIRAEPFWTDCALYADAGIPVVLFGAAGEGAHAATEWVSLESYRTVIRVLTDLIRTYCGAAVSG
ncbi:MAG TPA: ArgE/DapE family deacylase [Thermomicrobiales bacterium]|nr:ArgE/DapE family deacylase [Thermomicrobiales bacterium]